MATFKIQGTVREAESGMGLPHFGIILQGKEELLDDLLGGTVSDDDGCFVISGDLEHESDYCISVLNFIILTPDGRKIPYTIKKTVRWEAGYLEVIDLRIPREVLIDRRKDDLIAVERAYQCMGQSTPDSWQDSFCEGLCIHDREGENESIDNSDRDDLTGLLIP